MDYTKCYNTYDYITLNEWDEQLPTVKIRYIDSPESNPRITCYDSNSLNKWISIEDNIFSKWEHDPLSVMDDMGYGGHPNKKYKYIKMYTNEYIILDGNFEKLHILMQNGLVIADAIYVGTVRIGNIRGEFDIGDLHGQKPGQRIYQIVGHMITPGYDNISLKDFFSQFGIFSISDLYTKTRVMTRSWKKIGKLEMPEAEITLSGKKIGDKYILRTTTNNMEHIESVEPQDIMLFKINPDNLYDITILDTLNSTGDPENYDILQQPEDYTILPQKLRFETESETDAGPNYDDTSINDIETLINEFGISSLEEFIKKYILAEPSYIPMTNIILLDRLINSKGDELSLEKENDYYILRLIIFKDNEIISKIVFKFKYDSRNNELYDIYNYI